MAYDCQMERGKDLGLPDRQSQPRPAAAAAAPPQVTATLAKLICGTIFSAMMCAADGFRPSLFTCAPGWSVRHPLGQSSIWNGFLASVQKWFTYPGLIHPSVAVRGNAFHGANSDIPRRMSTFAPKDGRWGRARMMKSLPEQQFRIDDSAPISRRKWESRIFTARIRGARLPQLRSDGAAKCGWIPRCPHKKGPQFPICEFVTILLFAKYLAKVSS
jgi:hypothetical protein